MSFLIGLFSPVFSQYMSPFDSLFCRWRLSQPLCDIAASMTRPLHHEGAIQEPGNLWFDVLQDPRVKTRFFIYEAYRDEEAVLAHKQTPHYLACVEKLEDLMSEPRKKRPVAAAPYRAYGMMRVVL